MENLSFFLIIQLYWGSHQLSLFAHPKLGNNHKLKGKKDQAEDKDSKDSKSFEPFY